VVVTMGRRVLRSETAGIVASALVLDALGEMG
jgi:16S rRNA U1498 N3-methylase RsmE